MIGYAGVELYLLLQYEGTESAIKRLTTGKVVASDALMENMLYMERELAELRYSLTIGEIEQYRYVSKKVAGALESTCREIEPGWTEYEISVLLQTKVLKHGFMPHCVLVATDERIFKYRHPIPTIKRLQKYAMVVICAEKWGLISNATRFVHFGKLPEEIQEKKLSCSN